MTQEQDRDPLSDLPWPAPEKPSEQVSTAIRAQCTKDLRARRGMSCSTRGWISLGLSAALIAWLTYWAYDRHPQSELLRAGLLGALGWGVVQAGLLFFCLARPPGKRAPTQVRLGLLFLVPLFFFSYLALSGTGAVPFSEFSDSEHAGHALRCSLLTLTFGGLVAAGGLLIWRRTDPMNPGLSGALLGLVGGLGGSLAMGIACASHETWHLWFSHGLAVVALALIGWAAGRRVLAP